MLIRYKGPESRISFHAETAFSEQAAPPFLDRMQPVEVTDEIAARLLFSQVEVHKPDGSVVLQPRPSSEWEVVPVVAQLKAKGGRR